MKKKQISDIIIFLLIVIDGFLCILIARFAFEIGLDSDQTWGRIRFILLATGLILILMALLMIVLKSPKNNRTWLFRTSATVETFIMMGHLWVVIFLIYVWFVTYGTFTNWDHTSNYYSQLSNAFNNGRLYLDVKPCEAILDMTDPYNPENRPCQEEIWDMSLYKERIYLYWGPVPALLISPIQLLFNLKITDIFLDFFFYAGLVIVNSMLILKLRKNFFPNISMLNVFCCIVLISLISPVLWALIPATIYGTAIGAGNFFLMGGVYFALIAFEQNPFIDSKRLFLAGLMWTCSVGSRALNAPSIVLLAVLTAIWVVKMAPGPYNWRQYTRMIFPLFIPLIFGAIAMGWYNWARFGSPLEFGLRYQITFFNLNRDLVFTFQPDYFFLNLYVYFFQPFKLISSFPFIIPIYSPVIFAEHNIIPVKMYFAGRMTGLLFCAPFLLLVLVHFFVKKHVRTANPVYGFVVYGLTSSSLMGFWGLMFFFFGQMRYLVDIISQTTLLAILGYWHLISFGQKRKSIFLKLLVAASNGLLLFSVCAGLLLGITSETSRMEKLNPVLLDKISSSLSFEK